MDPTTTLVLIILLAALVVLAVILLLGIYLIEEYQVGIATRKIFGKKMPAGQVIARHGEIGVQAADPDARALLPDALHLVRSQGAGH